MSSMQALWLENQTASLRNDLPVPTPGKDEALVRVRMAGICATDLEMIAGYYPFQGIMGHEFTGELVSAAGNLPAGQRVVGDINISCGECTACRSGRRTHCERRKVLGIHQHDGTFAEYLTLPVENLHPVPSSVPDEAAVFTEPLAAAVEILEQVHVQPGQKVLLIGAGRLGQLIAQVLALTGCDLHVVARHDQQRALLTDRKIPSLEAGQVADHSQDIVVEATGSPGGFELARRVLRSRGLMVLKSTYAGGSIPVNLSALVVDEITLLGSRCGPFPPALRLLEQGKVDPRPLIARRVPLSAGVEALHYAGQPGVLKVILEPNG